jgi:DNA-binding response OmpR family regulator
MIARIDASLARRPRIVVAYADSVYAAQCARHFRRLGWEVHLAHSGHDARRLAGLIEPQVVVVDTELPSQSGGLACAKAMSASGSYRVVLVSPAVGEGELRLAEEIGAAAIVARTEPVKALVDCVLESAYQQAS